MYRHLLTAAALIFLSGPTFAQEKYSHHVYPRDELVGAACQDPKVANLYCTSRGLENFGIAGWCVDGPAQEVTVDVQAHPKGGETLFGVPPIKALICDGRIVTETRNPMFSTADVERVLKEQNARLQEIIQALAERNDRRITEGLGKIPAAVAANEVIANAEAKLDKKLEDRLQAIEDRLETAECAAGMGACAEPDALRGAGK
jgi:hypothetical protein